MRALLVILMTVSVLSACQAAGDPASPDSPASTPSGSGSSPAILPLLINSEIVKGPNRFQFSLTDRDNKLIAAPDVKVALEYFDVDAAPDTVAFTGDARFLWAIEGDSGLYVTSVDFPKAGRWGTRFTATFPDGRKEVVRADYDVAETGTTPALGAAAPSVDTPTLSDVDERIDELTTDKEPERRFYEASVADALAAGRPFVLSFATPAFCQTRLCGPTLETIKSVARERPETTFINVEPYRMKVEDGALTPELDGQGQLQIAPWTEAYGLRSEPMTFVVAGDGTVTAKFEGVLAADELTAALDEL